MEEETLGGGDLFAEELEGILKMGPPESVLKEEEVALRFSEILDVLAEERELGRLLDLPALTPEWSLFVRNYLEISHDRFDLEFEEEGTGEEGPVHGREGHEHGVSEAVFGIGLLIDADSRLPSSVTLSDLRPLARVIESAMSDPEHSVEVFLHPRILTLADLYTFSYESRRGFLEERLNLGFSMEKPDESKGLSVFSGDVLMGEWDLPAATVLSKGDPVLRSLGASLDEGRGAIVGLVRITPPLPGEWGDIIDSRFSTALGDTVGKAVVRVFGMPEEKEEEMGEGQVSIMPWSFLFPMGVTIALGAFLAEGLASGEINSERVGMTPLWKEGSLWIEIDKTGTGTSPLRFLAVDEYVGHFMETYVPQIMESMMGLSVRWNKRKGGGRALSLGIV